MQYFLGYASFSNQEPFDASLLTVFRKRLGMDLVNAINEQIVMLKARYDSQQQAPKEQDQDDASDNDDQSSSNKGKLIMDATACPQDIAYPTDLDLLSDARVKSEQLIDQLYDITIHKEKPRTYRQKARKKYLEVAQNRNKSRKIIRKAVGEQLRFLKRNIRNINRLLDTYATIPLKSKDYKYLLVIQTLYQQQNKMFEQRKHSIDHRIVSIHQPHVRPIVRGKSQAKVEFGAKIQVSLIDGISFLDKLSWEAFNEGVHMPQYIEPPRWRGFAIRAHSTPLARIPSSK
jgi:transposase, IS5 family